MSTGLIVMLSLVLGLPATTAGAALRGAPPQTVLIPDVDGYPEYTSVVRDHEGVLFIGSYDGIESFDGARWRHIELADHSLARRLAVGPAGRVYFRGQGTFGYLHRELDGTHTPIDLMPQFQAFLGPRRIADIWDIVVTPSAVYFKALRDLFQFDPQANDHRHWHHEGRFGAIVWDESALWLQFRGSGMKQLVDGEWIMVAETRDLTRHIPAMARFGQTLIGSDIDGNWHLLGDDALDAAALGPAEAVYAAISLPGGGAAFAFDSGSIVIIESDHSVSKVRVADSPILDLFHDPLQDVLIAAAGDTLRIIARRPFWTTLEGNDGPPGLTYGATILRGEVYVYGSNGVFRIRQGDDATSFESPGWGSFEVWQLLDLGPDVLVADSYDLISVDVAGSAKTVAIDIYPRALVRSRYNPDIVFVGTEQGLVVYSVSQARPIHTHERGDILHNSVIELAQGTLLVGTNGDGVRRLTWDEEASIISEDEPAPSPVGSSANGFVQRVGDQVIVYDDENYYRWSQATATFELAELGGLAEIAPGASLLVDAAGHWWAWTFNRVYRRHSEGVWRQIPTRTVTRGPISSATLLADGQLVYGAPEMLFMPVQHTVSTIQGSQVRLRGVVVTTSESVRALDVSQSHSLEPDDQSVRFLFALSDLTAPEAVRYQARLLGFESDFTPWLPTAEYTYSGLGPGNYRLEIRGRDADGNISHIAPFEFELLRLWYQRAWLWSLIALIALIAAAYAGNRWRMTQVARRTSQLEAAVATQTEELRVANRRLQALADLDGLTGIANRRHFDRQLEDWVNGPLALLMIDLDHFKAFNDERGHLAGDETLRQFASCLQRVCCDHKDALAARYGGEEFAVLLRCDKPDDVEGFARNLMRGWQGAVTVSMGIAIRRGDTAAAELIAAADSALYRAKDQGRNRIVVADQDKSV